MADIPRIRLRTVNAAEMRSDGKYVVYWMIAARRTRWNFALQRAIELSWELARPLVVLVVLRCDYRWACDRFHAFVLAGMRDNARRLAREDILYYPYLEPRSGAGRGLLETLSRQAAAIVTDDFPCFFLPHAVEAAGRKLEVRLEAIDSNGLLPLRATEKVFKRAHDFRRFLFRELAAHLEEMPLQDPLKGRRGTGRFRLPPEIPKRWPPIDLDNTDDTALLKSLPINHAIGAGCEPGGAEHAQQRLTDFLHNHLEDYAGQSRHPDAGATSDLSPYLHFGHISAHHVFEETLRACGVSVGELIASLRTLGKNKAWGLGESGDAFVDQLVTWRELGLNFCHLREDHDQFDSLPDWAWDTLEEHAGDRRPHIYTMKQLDAAETYDKLWNAAQRQLVREGRLHNSLRMLWGKRILEWTRHPREALDVMIELNNKYGTDGRDPNSYSGIFWVLGRYDRAWGPERPVYGKIRYMSSENSARKWRLKEYLRRFAE